MLTSIFSGVILNYALFLENLEFDFYVQFLNKFNADAFKAAGFPNGTYERLQNVKLNEGDHGKVLSAALAQKGVKAVAPCKYDFGFSKPEMDAKAGFALGAVLEGVGKNAYKYAQNWIQDASYRDTAVSIGQIEAAHDTAARTIQNQEPVPQPYVGGLSFNMVFTLAGGMVVKDSCPSENPKLPFAAFPALAANQTGPAKVGDEVFVSTPANMAVPSPFYAAFVGPLSVVPAEAKQVTGGFKIKIPKGVAGQSYAIITRCQGVVSDENTIAGPAIIEIEGSSLSQ